MTLQRHDAFILRLLTWISVIVQQNLIAILTREISALTARSDSRNKHPHRDSYKENASYTIYS